MIFNNYWRMILPSTTRIDKQQLKGETTVYVWWFDDASFDRCVVMKSR